MAAVVRIRPTVKAPSSALLSLYQRMEGKGYAEETTEEFNFYTMFFLFALLSKINAVARSRKKLPNLASHCYQYAKFHDAICTQRYSCTKKAPFCWKVFFYLLSGENGHG